MRRHRAAAPKAASFATILLVLAGTFGRPAGARADEWVERPFDPLAGNRWIIHSNETTRDERDGAEQMSVTSLTAELTIDEKTGEGFHITYVVQNAGYQGEARTAALIAPVLKLLENLHVHATTARNGMPLRIDNLDEIQVAARAAIDGLSAQFAEHPQLASMVRQLATRMLIANENLAPTVYLGSLATLALGQDTGLRPGETRRNDDVADPFGGTPIKSETTLRIESFDAATGNVRYVRTRTLDPDAIREFLKKMAQQLAGGKVPPEQTEKFLQQFTMTLDSRTEIDVEQGMTRAVREEDVARADTPGHSIVKRAHKLLTVAPAP
jgi:hypothetical protein